MSEQMAGHNYNNLVEANKLLVQKLSKHFSLKEDLVRNIVKFSKLTCKPGHDSIDGKMFSSVLARYFNVTDQTIIMHKYTNLSIKRKDGQMAMEDFAKIICSFMTSDLDIQIENAFSMYDKNGDGTIDVMEVLNFTKSCQCVTDTDDGDKDETFYDLSNMAANVLGVTLGNNGVNFEQFKSKVKDNQLIMSILGEAMPKNVDVAKFRALIEGKTNLQMIKMFGDIRYKLLREIPDKSACKYYPITLDLP